MGVKLFEVTIIMSSGNNIIYYTFAKTGDFAFDKITNTGDIKFSKIESYSTKDLTDNFI